MKHDLTVDEWKAKINGLPYLIIELIENAPQNVSNVQSLIDLLILTKQLSEKYKP